MKEEMLKVFNLEKERAEFKLTCVEQLAKSAEGLGAKILTDEFETNGWQYDYWMPCIFNGKRFILEGSGYYGNGSVFLDEDCEND